MATVFIDGFDKYGPVSVNAFNASELTQGEWTVASSGGFLIKAGLSATGYSLYLPSPNGLMLSKTLPNNYSRLICGFRFSTDLSGTFEITFTDSNTTQCSVSVNKTTGLFTVWTGDFFSGTKIVTSTTSITANTTHYLEVDMTFSATGTYNVWLDGVSLLTGTGNLKTTSNTTANQLQFLTSGTNAPVMQIDDLYLFDTTTSFNNAALLTNPRIETQYPVSDSQTQFTNVGTIIGQSYNVTLSGNDPGANTLFLRRFQSSVAQTVNSISCVPQTTNATANFKAVIYSDSAGNPNTLLSSGTQVTGTTANATLTGALTTPQALTAGTFYWIGFIGDTDITLQNVDSTTTGQQAANTYSSGAPATAPTMSINHASWVLWGNCTGAATNWEAVDIDPQPGDISSIKSSTVGNEDLYNFPGLTTNPLNIYTMAVKANCKRSDSGPRTIDLRTKSGATDSGGSVTGQTPATSYVWQDSYFDTDPATGAAWTTTGVNSAISGPKVSS